MQSSRFTIKVIYFWVPITDPSKTANSSSVAAAVLTLKNLLSPDLSRFQIWELE